MTTRANYIIAISVIFSIAFFCDKLAVTFFAYECELFFFLLSFSNYLHFFEKFFIFAFDYQSNYIRRQSNTELVFRSGRGITLSFFLTQLCYKNYINPAAWSAAFICLRSPTALNPYVMSAASGADFPSAIAVSVPQFQTE